MQEPGETVLMVIARYPDAEGGWGPASVVTPLGAGPFVYTGPAMDEMTVYAGELAERIARDQGYETRVVRYTTRVDVQTYKP
jgi:hypothetical protein